MTATPTHVPGLHSAGAAAGAFVLPYVPAGSAGFSPHPVPLLGGFPQAEVPLSTAAEGDDGSPQEASVFVWTVGISPQPAEARGRRGEVMRGKVSFVYNFKDGHCIKVFAWREHA